MHVSRRGPWLTLAACSLAAAPATGAEPASLVDSRLRATEVDFARLAPLTRSVMRSELDAVLAPAALSVAWSRSRPGDETDPDELRVILMRSTGLGADRGALGCTSRRGVLPTIWVYVPAVAAALGLDPPEIGTSFEVQRLVGVALGRVLAHELVHAIAPDVEHAGAGLMRARLHAFHLASGRPALEGACADSLAAAARAWLSDGTRRRSRPGRSPADPERPVAEVPE